MSWKRGLAVALAAGTITTTGMEALQPMTSHDNYQQEQQQEQRQQDKNDANWEAQRNKEMRRDGNDLGDQELLDRQQPAEIRPPVLDEEPRLWVDP